MTTRADLIRSLVDLGGRGLEIGPSYNPIVPKSSGANVEVLDHAPAQQLRAHYAGDVNVDSNLIEEVDFVTEGRSMVDAVGELGRYDWIIASHVIEHQPDLIGFLKDCSALLRANGKLALAVPDKRFCFDVFRPVSSTGALLQAHHEKRTRLPRAPCLTMWPILPG